MRAIGPQGNEVEVNASEKAFDLIFKNKGYRRVSEPVVAALQAEEQTAEHPLMAQTMGELKEMAEELGIDAETIERLKKKADAIELIDAAKAKVAAEVAPPAE